MNYNDYQNCLIVGTMIISSSIAITSLIGGYYLVGGIFALL